MLPAPSSVIGPYQVVRELGGMGIVFGVSLDGRRPRALLRASVLVGTLAIEGGAPGVEVWALE